MKNHEEWEMSGERGWIVPVGDRNHVMVLTDSRAVLTDGKG